MNGKSSILLAGNLYGELDMLSKFLTKKGFSVRQCDSKEEALTLLKEGEFHLLLMSPILKDGTGLSACRFIRKNLSDKQGFPILFALKTDELRLVSKTYEYGATDIIHTGEGWDLSILKLRQAIRYYKMFIELEKIESRQCSAQSIAKMGFVEWDSGLNQVSFSSGFEAIFDVILDASLNGIQKYMELIPARCRSIFSQEMNSVITGYHSSSSFEHRLISSHRERVIKSIISQESANRFLIIVQDITDIHDINSRLEHQDMYDSLTQLPNRNMLTGRIDQLFESKHSFALISIDINRFGMLNDILGHKEADRLLQKVAARISEFMPKKDLISRIGKDEFFILIQDAEPSKAHELKRVIDSLLDYLSERGYQFDQRQNVHVEFSAGIAYSGSCGDSPASIMNSASRARLSAKDMGGGLCVLYNSSLEVDSTKRIYMETELSKAISSDQFVLHYQPQICVKTKKVVGLEALIRWDHPEMGFVSPIHFIPIAEDLNLIHKLGNWILKKALEDAKSLFDSGVPVRIGINLSAKQFLKDDFEKVVYHYLEKTGLPPALVDLEITESVAMSDPEKVLDTLKNIKNTGVSLSIDDFGTGYSSLEYLQKFPVDHVKIDRTFVKNIIQSQSDQAIVQAIIGIALSMGMQVIAEGVESQAEYDLLEKLGCHEIQGYFTGKPMEFSHIKSFVENY